MAHFRYPEVLFEVQRQILAQYHVTVAQEFYGGQNFWAVPTDPSGLQPKQFSQPPYYMTINMPGYEQPKFSLTTSFTPRGRANISAYMAVDSTPGPGYGTIRLLTLPQDTAIQGPEQVQNDFESNPVVAPALTLLRAGGSKVTQGNLITLPVGGGLVYFEPVYVSQSAATSSGSYPTLQRVLVYYDGRIGYANTLQAALAQVFTAVPSQPGTGNQTPPPGGSGKVSAAVLKQLQQAEKFYSQAQQALKNGDLGAYGRDIAKVKEALDRARQAAGGGSAATKGQSPTPTPSASPTR
jgi:uncharacterized membrane protein (UPF0182 family)